ncbi:hypothetical protein EVAR_40939_1 [Eumeta japonica]|uniref:Uncharacterized protein n=1 Tax=Eumeta variegata TaxID=151549 RepID=A0A4C1X5E4_EUMVA|nr:hypothetical protein EVAR_40939_1 [Eumeta japonica]
MSFGRSEPLAEPTRGRGTEIGNKPVPRGSSVVSAVDRRVSAACNNSAPAAHRRVRIPATEQLDEKTDNLLLQKHVRPPAPPAPLVNSFGEGNPRRSNLLLNVSPRANLCSCGPREARATRHKKCLGKRTRPVPPRPAAPAPVTARPRGFFEHFKIN